MRRRTATPADRLLEHHGSVAVGLRRDGTRPGPGATDRPVDRARGGGPLAVAQGLTNSEIGERLYIGLSTVKTHLASLMTKLAARNRVELAMWAYVLVVRH